METLGSLSKLTLIPILSYLCYKGISIKDCLSEAKLNENTLNLDIISPDEIASIMDAASKLCNDNMVGLHSGLHINTTSLGVLGQLLLNSTDLQDAIEIFNKYKVLLCDSFCFKTDRSQKVLKLEFNSTKLGNINRNLVDSLFCSILTIIRKLVNKNVNPIEVKLTCPTISNYDEYLKIYNIYPNFNSTKNSMSFSYEILKYKVIFANKDIRLLLEDEVKRQISIKTPKTLIKEKIISSFFQDSPIKIPTIEETSFKLSMSKRKLQRNLADEGTSYRELVNEARIIIADKYLSQGNYTIAYIAYITGFSEESSFIRFYKRIKGITPGSFISLNKGISDISA